MDKPQPLQPEELKAIEARCEAATPGPWEERTTEEGVRWIRTMADVPCQWTMTMPRGPQECNHENDWHFIAAARTDIPRLIATIEEMAGEVAQAHVTVRKNAELALENKNLLSKSRKQP